MPQGPWSGSGPVDEEVHSDATLEHLDELRLRHALRPLARCSLYLLVGESAASAFSAPRRQPRRLFIGGAVPDQGAGGPESAAAQRQALELPKVLADAAVRRVHQAPGQRGGRIDGAV